MTATLGGVIAIIRLGAEPPDALFAALLRGGVRTVEVTVPTPGALDAISRWSREPDALVGAGTVRHVADVERAVDAGARFLVTPATDQAVLAAAAAREVAILAGALTPSEIEAAAAGGATAVKVFPAGPVGGPAYLRAIRAPLDDIPLVPTGGVEIDDAEAYARLGCRGVGVGSPLVDEGSVRRGDWDGIAARAAAFRDAWERGFRA